MTLTATLIVRNEAPVLGRCLASIRPLVDEIVVVDTGSTDGSQWVARDFGAEVVPFGWRDDFAAARNEALAHARGRWILYVDADEEVRPVDRTALAAHLADERLVGSTVRFRPRTGFTRYRECRLFRNDPRIRFRHPIHETMVPDVLAVAGTDGLLVGRSDLTLDHFGYDGDQRGKHRRDVPLLRARLAQEPDHVYSWNHLGRALADLGNLEGALAAWWRGVAIVRARGPSGALDSLPYGSLLLQERVAPEAPALLAEAVALFPGDHLLAWLWGKRLMEGGRFDGAVPVLERLVAIDAATFCDDEGLAYDARIFGLFSYDALALCHFRLGRYGASARYYALAQRAAPDKLAYRVKRECAEARARSVS